MKFGNLLFSIAIGLFTFGLGLAVAGVFGFFYGAPAAEKPHFCKVKKLDKATGVIKTGTPDFDINDPDSVLPLDHEEDKLTSPKSDENDTLYFDPEGVYFPLEETTADFEDLSYIKIENKRLDVPAYDERFGDPIAPKGVVVIDERQQLELSRIEIANGKMHTETKENNGIKYEFDGEFVVKGNFYTLDENAQVLKGTLVKKRNGEVIAKGDIAFGWALE